MTVLLYCPQTYPPDRAPFLGYIHSEPLRLRLNRSLWIDHNVHACTGAIYRKIGHPLSITKILPFAIYKYIYLVLVIIMIMRVLQKVVLLVPQDLLGVGGGLYVWILPCNTQSAPRAILLISSLCVVCSIASSAEKNTESIHMITDPTVLLDLIYFTFS